ncbi:hypothetical protein LINPERPRIM_LOCUS22082 [Linum perenne]
MKQTRSIVLV